MLEEYHSKMAERCTKRSPLDREIEQAIVSLKKGAHLLKCGRRGKPKFCPFRLSTDFRFQFISTMKVLEKPVSLTYIHAHGDKWTAVDTSVAFDPANKVTMSYVENLYVCMIHQDEADVDSADETMVLETESELFSGFSKGDSSEYSFSETEENFSERSSENSTPSAAFALYFQLAKQFVKLCSKEKSRNLQSDNSLDFTMSEEEEIEESYKNIQSRERSEVVLNNLAEDYRSTIDFGNQMLQQRLDMVNWMVENSQATELHQETLFLSMSLMDRFLSRGYFESERNFQLLGIASVTLATRLEEVQPWNRIRRRSFMVESNTYSRCEVVTMEWLLLEVLNFKCMIQ